MPLVKTYYDENCTGVNPIEEGDQDDDRFCDPKNKKKKVGKKILIEDGTLAAFGFSNPSEVNV